MDHSMLLTWNKIDQLCLAPQITGKFVTQGGILICNTICTTVIDVDLNLKSHVSSIRQIRFIKHAVNKWWADAVCRLMEYKARTISQSGSIIHTFFSEFSKKSLQLETKSLFIIRIPISCTLYETRHCTILPCNGAISEVWHDKSAEKKYPCLAN